MGFVQIMDITTDDIGPVQKIGEEWVERTAGKRTARRQVITRDRNEPDRYRLFIFFDSYESAMANSQLPETQELAQRMQAAVKDIAFQDLDVIEDNQF